MRFFLSLSLRFGCSLFLPLFLSSRRRRISSGNNLFFSPRGGLDTPGAEMSGLSLLCMYSAKELVRVNELPFCLCNEEYAVSPEARNLLRVMACFAFSLITRRICRNSTRCGMQMHVRRRELVTVANSVACMCMCVFTCDSSIMSLYPVSSYSLLDIPYSRACFLRVLRVSMKTECGRERGRMRWKIFTRCRHTLLPIDRHSSSSYRQRSSATMEQFR